MKYDILQIAGAIVMVVFAQGAIRLLFDHTDTGFLGWLGGGFALTLAVHLALFAMGVLLTGWSHTRAKALGRRG
ncbi:hypothetical protein ACWCO0_03635 [Streptomyces tubercidicus]|uniref:Uncharacterized protein n=1 Tax=Streptomyces tubercidicus TaxID=47759 RepID=A0A640UK82_9ACTN|nr:hypothetical protein [Streptomyces tubercidicus]WAU11230.1 hypothetical protein STRTU_001414 [Streptomyces tubercidicus]GFE36463.1 hypothetical protein Stube_11360 [Streptomyces tubercidicus]